MDIVIKKALAEGIGEKEFREFDLTEDSWQYSSSRSIDLEYMDEKKLDKLEALFKAHPKVTGTKRLLWDLQLWRRTLNDPTEVKPRTVRQFEPILIKYLQPLKHHWVYSKRYDDTWLPCYVAKIQYLPPQPSRGDGAIPDYVKMDLWYETLGGRRSGSVSFYEDDVRGYTVAEILAKEGYFIENDELNEQHFADMEVWRKTVPLIGSQYLAFGVGVADVDGNESRRERTNWWQRSSDRVALFRNGEPTRVVVDIFNEGEKDRERNQYVEKWFWQKLTDSKRVKLGNGDRERDLTEDELNSTEEQIPEIEIPTHPFLVVFDLSKHKRLRVHINQLQEYAYDRNLADKLILPPDQKALVKLLVSGDATQFTDIIKGKSGGAIVLLCGAPGTGKTLTAEVFAESEARALYSVQCSQLGTDPDELEDELLKVFTRALRWKAVLLLDEADVYVHARGNDLQQNAIVGVFLRVLEYMSSVMFLTTNRPEDVDDAIASRCIARLNYKVPSTDDQKRIWQVLARGAKIKISDDDIIKIAFANKQLSGRDVKNLLKLAALLQQGKAVTPESIEFVKQFKPTGV